MVNGDKRVDPFLDMSRYDFFNDMLTLGKNITVSQYWPMTASKMSYCTIYRGEKRQGKASLFVQHISYTEVIQGAKHKIKKRTTQRERESEKNKNDNRIQ